MFVHPPNDTTTPDVHIAAAATPAAYAEARALFAEYAAFLEEDLAYERFADELTSLADSYVVILLARDGGAPAAAVGLKRLEDGVCEMKRLYCRPAFRGRGLGRALCAVLFAEARARGFRRMRLDTLARLGEAVALYRALGFRRIAPYNDNPLHGVLHMEKAL